MPLFLVIIDLPSTLDERKCNFYRPAEQWPPTLRQDSNNFELQHTHRRGKSSFQAFCDTSDDIPTHRYLGEFKHIKRGNEGTTKLQCLRLRSLSTLSSLRHSNHGLPDPIRPYHPRCRGFRCSFSSGELWWRTIGQERCCTPIFPVTLCIMLLIGSLVLRLVPSVGRYPGEPVRSYRRH